jgi:signal transduction histidine kinase
VAVDVFDDGRASAPVSPFGHGLIGMRERTAAYGGTVEAGPAPGGGWRVHARVPLDQEAVAG